MKKVFLEINPAKAHNAVARLVRKLSSCYEKLYFCYEAGPTGHGLYWQILPHNGAKTLVFDTLGQHRLPLQRHPIICEPVCSILLFGANNETLAAGVIGKLVSLP